MSLYTHIIYNVHSVILFSEILGRRRGARARPGGEAKDNAEEEKEVEEEEREGKETERVGRVGVVNSYTKSIRVSVCECGARIEPLACFM